MSDIQNALNLRYLEVCSVFSGSVTNATRLCSVAMREKDSDVIEVRLGDKADELQVLMNQQVLTFSEQKWMDLKGKSCVPNNILYTVNLNYALYTQPFSV